jgi:hypothetical protein
MERTIDLRQRGYRHRAFILVNTDEGSPYFSVGLRVCRLAGATFSPNLWERPCYWRRYKSYLVSLLAQHGPQEVRSRAGL